MQATHLVAVSRGNVTCRVVSVAQHDDKTVLTAHPPKAAPFEVGVDELADPFRADELTSDGVRVLSVQFVRDAEELKAHAYVMTAAGGAQRVEVLTSVALALCERGIGGTWIGPAA